MVKTFAFCRLIIATVRACAFVRTTATTATATTATLAFWIGLVYVIFT
jgi:hypothetical protein